MALNLSALAATIVILTAGVALAGALIWPKTYTARAEVLYPITQEQPTGFLREDRSLTTQLVLIRSRPILDPIAAQQGRDVVDLQKDITATVLESSEIIQLEVKDRSAERAVQTAQAVLAGYLEFSRSGQPTQRGRIETGLAAVTTALADAQKAFDTQQAQVTVGKATADTLASLQRTVQAQQLRQQHLAPVAQQLTAPYPTDVVYPQPLIVTATGALLGLLLAACVVVVVARGWMRG
jgi:LPS O-antigen subunit length determinant protein (WzzB/FepE family)